MEWNWYQFVWCIISCLIPAILFNRRRLSRQKSNNKRLPPGPPGWPVFGNMFDLGDMPHRTLARLKQKYGPVVWLRIGAINTMVVQSADAAEEFFKKHDVVFAERTVTEVMKAHDFYKGSVAIAPYGAFWRVMKRIMTVEMLVQKKINETAHVRRRCIDHMLTWIATEADAPSSSTGIQVARFVFLASFNMLGNLMLSRDLADPNSEEGSEFFAAMVSLMEWAGHPNVVDLFPWLKWLDPQGLRKKSDRDMGKTMQIVSKYVKERVEERRRRQGNQGGQEIRKDYLEVLLDYEGNGKDEPDKISDHDLNIIVMEVFLAGSETTSGTTEWAMVELLSNPIVMSKLKDELNELVGVANKVVESDIDNLKYLQAVVKETLRLHPPIPFLVPRRATQDTNFMGYDIPKNTQVFVNVSAIGRDPDGWEDPECFKPERFLGSGIDFKGNHFELLPFGAGRRICAGIPLAHRMLHLVLASLVHEFDWSVHSSVANNVRDTKERMGVVVRKIEPLIAIPTPKQLAT
ncbi:OLC1v1034353C1 [Oldenlandia corymbosa var. corymbosa]|uniref:OLC1v1034353C1 n=1 Tax=Oldenlandia corymbosa var. corymbosa TaxID=529605 RepID=A0AAV1CQE7_OLDCO|nr:OLC1v1034353C1 [Oldenlandia corymbosa var. corymbosa]